MGLSPGAIAGIVIGSLCGLALFIAPLIWLQLRRRQAIQTDESAQMSNLPSPIVVPPELGKISPPPGRPVYPYPPPQHLDQRPQQHDYKGYQPQQPVAVQEVEYNDLQGFYGRQDGGSYAPPTDEGLVNHGSMMVKGIKRDMGEEMMGIEFPSIGKDRA